jgi:FdhD protein
MRRIPRQLTTGGNALGPIVQRDIIHWDAKTNQTVQHELIGEEPLSIRIQGKPYSVVMRTPGDELAHVAGFCLGEGIIDRQEDYTSLGFCGGGETNVVTVTLTPSRREKILPTLERRSYISQTSCGLCGKELVQDLYQIIHPLTDDFALNIRNALRCLDDLPRFQPMRRQTKAAHAAAIYSRDFELLGVGEDVGRHNALDKAIGKVFLDRKLDRAALLILSSRISYELVQKAARARIPVIVAVSRPTGLAVELAAELNMTIASWAKQAGLFIFCGAQRLKGI